MPALRFTVPASTTNLGHGFDCLGLAVGLHNTVTVTVDAGAGDAVTAPEAADPGLAPMAARVRAACAAAWGASLPGFSVRVAGEVPIARGLGSSSTILLGVAAACQRLAGRALDRAALLPIAAELEGHPDNVAAACLGGFTVVGAVAAAAGSGGLRWARFPVPDDLVAVLAIPAYEVRTSEARRILPAQTTRGEHVRAVQRTALITAALAAGRAGDLAGVFADAWHEGHRAALNPSLRAVRADADAAGAIGTILSGSGSTLLTFALRGRAELIAAAIAAGCRARGEETTVRVAPFSNQGLAEA